MSSQAHNWWERFRSQAVRLIRVGVEALVLGLVCLSPWVFGAVEPVFELMVYATIALVVALWGALYVFEWRFSWKKCPVALGLAGLFLTGVWQLAPLPRLWLQWLSPSTGRMYDQLLPGREEVLPYGEGRETTQPAAGSTISFYPAATRKELVRLLAVFLLFAAVRNNIASVEALRRLSIAGLVNGALLALFGLIQFFTSAPNTLYWTFTSAGGGFGPFICRNHFPFYVNVCLGLAAGLLYRSRETRTIRKPRGAWGGLSDLLVDPWALWIISALALMLGALFCCLSRGGILAMLGAMSLCLTIKLVRLPRSSGLGYFSLALLLGLLLAAWFGFDPIKERLATLFQKDTYEYARTEIWSRVWPLVREYPLWGTGYGTFGFVEPLRRTSPTEVGLLFDHAHNDYLEALVEGGLVGALWIGLVVGMVFRLAYRAICRSAGGPAEGLALGGLFGVTAVAIHSWGDFGLHIPAIAVLVTVLGAQLCALGTPEGSEQAKSVHGEVAGEYSLSVKGLAPLMGASAAVVFGWLLVSEGWKADHVHRYRLSAFRVENAPEDGGRDRRIDFLEAAARLAPDYAGLQSELGLAHMARFERGTENLEEKVGLRESVQAVFAGASSGNGGWIQAVSCIASIRLTSAGLRENLAPAEERLTRDHLVPALRHLVRARDLCPLMSQPHIRIAAHRDDLEDGDERSLYLGRAKLLMAPDPDLWYMCGVQELLEGQKDQAWKSWRHSLELSDRHLAPILQTTSETLEPAAILHQLLPEKPALLLEAAYRLFPDSWAGAERQPFLEKALTLLENQPDPLKAEDLRAKGVIYRSQGRLLLARLVYQEALVLEPTRVAWRLELASVLEQSGDLPESRRELIGLLRQMPNHAEARKLLMAVELRLAERP